jgi:murein L,D-transpeptidase YafK
LSGLTLSRKALTGLIVGLLVVLGIALLVLGKPHGGWLAAGTPKASPQQVSSPAPQRPQPSGAAQETASATVPSPKAAAPTEGATISANQLLQSGHLPEGHPEKRLIEIYALIESGDFSTALDRSGKLVHDHPNFQLAQLVHGDLLQLRYKPTPDPDTLGLTAGAGAQMAALRAESRMRLDALRNRPAPGSIPRQLLAVSSQTRHAIAIDASRGRLYVFENQGPNAADGAPRLKLLADAFISVGKSGIRKQVEGDGRTPLGNYYITSVRDRKTLPEFYGAGALPINYPNAFDNHRGRTGSGIWLHGTPPNQFVRAPLASDGCVVLANPDMQSLLNMVAPRTTPVVIAEQLEWTDPAALVPERQAFETLLQRWQADRSSLTNQDLAQTYQVPAQGLQRVKATEADLAVDPSVRLGFAQLSLLQSRQPDEGMVVTFEETVNDRPSGVIRRQYWLKQDAQWKLLQDSILSGTPSAQLKRQPPKLEAALTPPKAEASPASSHAAPARGDTPVAARGQDAAVHQAVMAWSKAWSQKNMSAYLKAYDSSFVPPGGASRKAWEKDRIDRIVYKSSISLSLANLKISTQGDHATVTFVQHYKADQLQVSGRKTLKLVRRGNDWRITHESVG